MCCMLNINGPPPMMCIVKRQSPMEIEHIEKSLGMKLPERHKKAMFDARDRIHSVCDFLLSHNTDKIPDLVEENKRLHNTDIDPWPLHLVAFASNGCGDF